MFLECKIVLGRREEDEVRCNSSLDEVIISKVIKPGPGHGLDKLIMIDINLYILILFLKK